MIVKIDFMLSMRNGKRSSLWLLKPYMLKYKKLWIAGFISVTVSTAFAVAAPWILKNAINSLSTNVTTDGLLGYGFAIVGVTIMSGILTYFMRQTMIVASRRIEYDFRNDFFAHLMKLDKPFYDKTPTGDIMAKATNDIDAVRNMIGPGIMYFYSTGMTLIFALTLMMNISVSLTFLSILPMPIISVLVFLLGRELNKRFAVIQKQYSTITARAQESFSGIRVVKAYVQENAELDDFSKLNKDYMTMNMSMVKIWGMFFPAIVLFSGTAVVMVLWFGGKAVIADKIGIGEFVAFIMYLLMLIWPMAALGWVISMYQQGKASMVRLESMLNSQPIVQNNVNAAARPIMGKIEFRNLRFSYDNKEVINGIDAVIEAGTNVAIIGATGSGKTTLVSLLTLAYPVERGMIFIDDIDINEYTSGIASFADFAGNARDVSIFGDYQEQYLLRKLRAGHRERDEFRRRCRNLERDK